MKETRIEWLVSWFFTGGILICVALFFLVRGWFMTELGAAPISSHGTLDPQTALVGASVLFIVGSTIIAFAVVARLRTRR
jgi:hypothetical protein